MGLDLFEENGDDVNEISKIKVNKEFARKYEYNKRREDLQRLQELKKRGLAGDASGPESTSDAETEDDEGILLPKNDIKFYEVLAKVKKNDPSLLQKDVKLFPSDDEDAEDDDSQGEDTRMKDHKKKPLYLKDVVAKQLMENGSEIEDDVPKFAPKSYVEEQEENRLAVLNAAREAFKEDKDDFFREKKTKKENEIGGGDEKIANILDECFSNDNPDEMAFWKDYLLNKQWICKDDKKNLLEEDIGLSEDEEALEEHDRYEAEYNFRFEEGASDQVMGFSRQIEGSVRKKDSARKSQRMRKKERLAQAKFEGKEELKRLKNVKKQELWEKLERIRNVAGIAGEKDLGLSEKDLEGEFDPHEFDKKMKETFDEKYYEEEDANADFHSDGVDDLEKPDFDKEDELLGIPKGWDEYGSGEGFLATRERVLKGKHGNTSEAAANEMEAIGEADGDQKELESGSKKKKKVKFSLEDQVSLEKELDEYYKLDYEDTIGDLKTRFKYRSVPSNQYGLSAAEILMADDKDLNQYVSLKKLAPYRPEEYKIPKHTRHNRKQKILLSLQESLKSEGHKIKKKHEVDGHKKKRKAGEHDQEDSSDLRAMEKEKPKLEESNGEDVQLSRRARRRRRQAELKISQSRLMAYGQIPLKSKKTTKHQE